MTTSKPKNDTKPFKEKVKEQMQGWTQAKKKRFAFATMTLLVLLAFTQFATGIRDTYRIFNSDRHFLADSTTAADTLSIYQMLLASDSSHRAQKQHIDSLLEKGLILTTLSDGNDR